MKEFKIIFAGSMGAGKTTAIKSLSESEVVSTDVTNSDRKAHSKLLTTVGIDYGQIMLPPDVKIGLYGTPGQERFELVWRIVTEGALGAIIMVDSSNPKAPQELPYYVNYFHRHKMNNIIVAITHCDMPGYLTLDDAFKILAEQSITFPVFEIDSRKKDDVLLLVETLIASIEAEIA